MYTTPPGAKALLNSQPQCRHPQGSGCVVCTLGREMPPYWLIRNLWVRMGHFQRHPFAALVCLDLFSYHDVFSSPPSTLIYRRGGVSSILTQRGLCSDAVYGN